MCFLRLLILLVIVSLQHLVAKAEPQLFIFPLISNLQSHPGLVPVCVVDFLTKTNSTSGGFMNQRDVFFLDRPDCGVGSRCPAVTWERADGHCWSQQGADGQVTCWRSANRVKPGCFCFTLQLLHQCCQLCPGGVPLESARARFVTWGKNCCANQVNTKIQTEMLWVSFGLKRHISSCVLLHFGGQQA